MPHRKSNIQSLDDSFIDTIKAARILRVSPSTLSQWRQRDIGPPYYKIGRTIRYKVVDIKDYCVRVVPSKDKPYDKKQVQSEENNS